MTVRKKALEIVNKIYEILLREGHLQSYHAAKQCALIAVDELIRIAPWGDSPSVDEDDGSKYFYINVKQEIINKL